MVVVRSCVCVICGCVFVVVFVVVCCVSVCGVWALAVDVRGCPLRFAAALLPLLLLLAACCLLPFKVFKALTFLHLDRIQLCHPSAVASFHLRLPHQNRCFVFLGSV